MPAAGAGNPAVLNISGGTLQAGNWANGNAGAGLQVGVGGAAGVVNQSGGVVNVEGWDAFAVGGAIFGSTPGQGTYNLSAGTLNTGYYGNGYTEIGVAGGTGVVNVSGGVWNISANAPSGPGGGQGGSSLLNIGSGNAPDYDAPGTGSVVISGGQVNAFGGITVGNVYNQGGAGLLSLQGGLLNLTSGTAGSFGGLILVGSGGTLNTSTGTLENVAQILGNVTISGTTANGTPLPLTKSGAGILVLAGANTYTGGTNVNAGVLQVKTPGSLPGYNAPNSVSVAPAAMLAVNVGGSGQWNSSATDNIAALLGNANFAAGAALGIDTTDATIAVTYSGVIGGNVALAKLGPNTLILTGSNTYSGSTTISSGTLQLGNGAVAGSINNTSGVANSGVLAFNLSSGTTTFAQSVSGTGSLVQMGANTLCLTGSNTYSGGTNLIAGALQVDAGSTVAGGTLASGPLGVGAVNLSGGTLQDNGSGVTLANAVNISGSVTLSGLTLGPQGLGTPNAVTLTGAPTIAVAAPVTIADPVSGNLVMAGPSTLTLTAAANSLSGATQLSGGTLVGTAANIATPVALANAANVTYNQAVNGTLNQPISGNGSLTKAGPAVLTVTASNTYTGLTTINSGGTLQLGNGANAGSINGTSGVADSGVLAFDLPSAASFSPAVSGTGGLVQMGANVVILTGNNTYTGGTTINSGGTLQIGDGANPGSINNTSGVANSGVLAFNVPSAASFSPAVSGNGGLVQMASSVLCLTGSNMYTGATTISAGTLQLGNGSTPGSIDSSSGVMDNGVLAFDEPSAAIFAQSVSGTGSLVQMASGVLTLTGSNTYTGGTTVSEGTLEIADPTVLPATGMINVGRSGTVSLLGLLVIPDVAGLDESQVSIDAAMEPAASTPAAATVPAVAEAALPVITGGAGLMGASPADDFAPVPEPGTLALLLAGAAGLALAGRVKQRR